MKKIRIDFKTICYNFLTVFLSFLITLEISYPTELVSLPWVTCESTYYEVRHQRCPGPHCGKINVCAYCVYGGIQCEKFNGLEHASTEIISSSNDQGKEFLEKLVESINKRNRGFLNLGLKQEILDMVREYDSLMESFVSGDSFTSDSLKNRNAYYAIGWLRDLMIASLKTEKEAAKQKIRVKTAIFIQKTLIEMVSIGNILNVSTSFIPFVGDARDLYELSSGFDFITGEKLTRFERILSGTGLLIGSGNLFRTAIKKLTKNHMKALIESSGRIIDSARKLGLQAKSEIADFAGIMKKASQVGSSRLHEPFGELAEKVAKGIGSKDGLSFVKGIPSLKYTGKATWQSKAGLKYGTNWKDNNSLKHILKHTKPNPSKAAHSVFKAKPKNVPSLIDEAWSKRIPGSGVVQRNGRTKYSIPMGREIGTKGEDTLTIIIRENTKSDIVTAFPVGQ